MDLIKEQTELIDLGSDISKVRTRLKSNVIYFEAEQYLNMLFYDNKPKKVSKDPVLNYLYNTWEIIFEHQILLDFLKVIIENPTKVNRFSIQLIEQMASEPLNNRILSYLDVICHQRLDKIFNHSNDNVLVQLAKLKKEEDPAGPDYPLLFALTLRQTSVYDLEIFLRKKKRLFGTGYMLFLKNILLDFDGVFPQKIHLKTKEWIQQEQLVIEKKRKEGFMDPPKGWSRIEGRLSPNQLKQVFSFLFEIANYTNDHQGYLEKDEVDILLEYGLSYPKQLVFNERFTLNLTRERNLTLFCQVIFRIMISHRKNSWDIENKQKWVLFLKHRFTNFDHLDEKSMRNKLRNRAPKIIPVGFDLENYF